MSDLQLALIAAGVAAVGGVWAYNKWQERAHRRLAEKAFQGDQPDVLMAAAGQESPARPESGERLEPVLELPDPPAEPAAVSLEPEPETETAESATPGPAATPGGLPPLPPLPAEWADEIADCVIRLDFVEPLAAPSLWAAQLVWAGHLGKTLSWLGYDAATGWQRLGTDDPGRYQVVCAALQLADRQGAVSDAELSVFLDGVRQLAQQFTGVADLPARDAVLLHARAVDEFCASVDLQLGVNVVEGDGRPFAGTKLRGLTQALGLELREDGLFHACDDAGRSLFTVGNLGPEPFAAETLRSLATHGVTLSLDVPRVAHGKAALERMLTAAQQLTQGLNGVLVDAQRRPLSAEMIAGIRAKVSDLQEQMAARQIPAGSLRALRLFS